MKALLSLFLLPLVIVISPTPAQASDTLPVSIVKNTDCDRRAPRVKVTVGEGARRVGFGPVESDTIYWLDTHGVEPGKHRYTLARQPFGSTREWVMVAAYEDQPHGLVTSRTLSFTRPGKSSCVFKQNPRITSYSTDVNTACDEGFDKMVVATLTVMRGTPGYIVRPGVTELVTKRDRELHSLRENTSFVGGGKGARRQVEYYFFTGRRAKFKLDPSENGIWPVKTSSNDVELLASLDAACMSQVP